MEVTGRETGTEAGLISINFYFPSASFTTCAQQSSVSPIVDNQAQIPKYGLEMLCQMSLERPPAISMYSASYILHCSQIVFLQILNRPHSFCFPRVCLNLLGVYDIFMIYSTFTPHFKLVLSQLLLIHEVSLSHCSCPTQVIVVSSKICQIQSLSSKHLIFSMVVSPKVALHHHLIQYFTYYLSFKISLHKTFHIPTSHVMSEIS
jgi:hypothetical protein